ncbi:MAG TPA: CoA-binding protein [Vicinamibacteria bacterium]|nr:CoA-binding protein [Vicinamibacteria bacterium]
MASKQAIDSFLSCRRIAVVGVSRDPKDFSRAVFRAFVERGYDVVPVNAAGGDVEGRPSARRVDEVQPLPEAAFLLTPPRATEQVVRECAEAGVRRVWMHRGAGQGAVSPQAVALCRERGIEVVDGECPFMFFPDAGWFHGVHRFFRRLGGRLPS